MVAIKNRAIQLLVLGLMVVGGAFAQDATMSCTLIGTQHNIRAEGQPSFWATSPIHVTRATSQRLESSTRNSSTSSLISA